MSDIDLVDWLGGTRKSQDWHIDPQEISGGEPVIGIAEPVVQSLNAKWRAVLVQRLTGRRDHTTNFASWDAIKAKMRGRGRAIIVSPQIKGDTTEYFDRMGLTVPAGSVGVPHAGPALFVGGVGYAASITFGTTQGTPAFGNTFTLSTPAPPFMAGDYVTYAGRMRIITEVLGNGVFEFEPMTLRAVPAGTRVDPLARCRMVISRDNPPRYTEVASPIAEFTLDLIEQPSPDAY